MWAAREGDSGDFLAMQGNASGGVVSGRSERGGTTLEGARREAADLLPAGGRVEMSCHRHMGERGGTLPSSLGSVKTDGTVKR